MPLRKGKSKKVVSGNIGEMMHSETFGAGKDPKTRRLMAIAAAMRKAGKARKNAKR